MDKVAQATGDAMMAVDDFVHKHHAAAIPALLAACALWASNHGGGEVLRGSLEGAIKLSHALDAEIQRSAQ